MDGEFSIPTRPTQRGVICCCLVFVGPVSSFLNRDARESVSPNGSTIYRIWWVSTATAPVGIYGDIIIFAGDPLNYQPVDLAVESLWAFSTCPLVTLFDEAFWTCLSFLWFPHSERGQLIQDHRELNMPSDNDDGEGLIYIVYQIPLTLWWRIWRLKSRERDDLNWGIISRGVLAKISSTRRIMESLFAGTDSLATFKLIDPTWSPSMAEGLEPVSNIGFKYACRSLINSEYLDSISMISNFIASFVSSYGGH